MFADRAVNSKLEGISTPELVKELLDRRSLYVEQLGRIAELFASPLAGKPSTASRPAAASPPAPAANGAPRRAQVLAVLTRAGRPLRTGELVPLLVEGGWRTTAQSRSKLVSTCLSALVKSRVLKRTAGGAFAITAGAPGESKPRPVRRPKGSKTKTKKGKNGLLGTPRPVEGQRAGDYLLAALAEVGEPCKAEDLLERVRKAGWTSSAKDPAKVLETTLRKLASQRKVKALGARVFEAVR